ncbi:MurR/RpiR family transcriptional regulator [Paenibacillus sp.]|uniref:MurR/RpiR family transcriptional regulator n=1 Tax=Paenibacillus sp. TaxID=58172 RepID=UPI00281224DF|nr:MurR/RpiR family transcriptional regulator [Paenibacillus sp.]
MKKTLHSSPLFLMIESVYPSLTKAEQKVADKVLAEPEEAVFYTITDLAEKSEVGETTVIRLCRKLGFKGYQEFKLSVVQNVSSPTERIHGDIQEDDSLLTIAQKISNLNTRTIQNTTALLNEESLHRSVSLLSDANKIFFFGVGSSGITIRDAKYRFMRLGFNVEAETDAHIIAMNASLAAKGDVVVGVSASGSTKDLVDAIRIAKGNGAAVICLTNHIRSPITQYADVVLLGSSRENPLQGGAFASKLAQIHILDILSTGLAFRHKEKTYDALEKTAKSVLDKLY